MENHMCFLLVRYVDLIMQSTKQHFLLDDIKNFPFKKGQ